MTATPPPVPRPRVSVLVPTYCRSALLPFALRSALAQTFADFEVLVLDNASPDQGQTTAAVQPFLAADPRVKYLRHEENLGITGNWRAGIAAAAGDYFCLLHDDDTLEPTFLAELVAALDAHPDAIVSFCDHWVTHANGDCDVAATEQATRQFGRAGLPAGPVADFARATLVDGVLCVGAALFRRSAVPPAFIDDAARGSIDLWLCYQCVATGMAAVYVQARLMNYRLHGSGMSATQPLHMTAGHLWRFKAILADPRLVPIHSIIADRRQAALADYGVHLLAVGNRRAAAIALREAAGRKAQLGRWLLRAGPIGSALARLVRRLRRLSPPEADHVVAMAAL